MAQSPGPATILSTTVACIIGLIVYVVVLAEPRPAQPPGAAPPQGVSGRGACPAGCDCFGSKGLERIRSTGTHEWFDGQCWTTTPQPPLDMSVAPLYRNPQVGREGLPRK